MGTTLISLTHAMQNFVSVDITYLHRVGVSWMPRGVRRVYQVKGTSNLENRGLCALSLVFMG